MAESKDVKDVRLRITAIRICTCPWWRRLLGCHLAHPEIKRSRYAPGVKG